MSKFNCGGYLKFPYVICLTMVLGLGGIALAESLDLSRRLEFNIQAGKLSDALIEFSKQARIQVLTSGEATADATTEGLSGTATVGDALTQLLRNSGLGYKVMASNAVAIAPVDVSSSAHGEGNMRMAAQQASTSGVQGMQQVAEPSAQSSDSSANEIDEIVVTAQKREERLQDVPISISVLGGDHLDRSTAQSVTEELMRVPGVSFDGSPGAGSGQLKIRGVAAGAAAFTGPSTVAYYMDGVPFGLVKSAISPDPDGYDLERVEVLRGPQGTLYGASALNGVVRVLTKDANPDAFELKVRASGSATEDGGENYRGDMAVNVPIVEGKLAARAVVGYQDLSGWIDRLNNPDANDAQRRNMRLKINAQPTEQMSIGLSVWSSKTDYGAPATGTENRDINSAAKEPSSIDYDAYGLTIGYEFPSFSVASMTSYLNYTNESLADIGVPLVINTEAKALAQEVILTSTHEGSWRWSAGGIYRDTEDSAFAALPTLFPSDNKNDFMSESYALFGELTRLLLDGRLEVTVGLRHFEDDGALRERSRIGPAPVPPEELAKRDAKYSANTPRFVLTWHPGQQTTLYASYSEGFRSGSDQFGTAVLINPPPPPVDADHLANYEVGAKGSLLGGRLEFDTALYYMDWQDLQQELLLPILGDNYLFMVNGESASGLGFDFGMTTQPAQGLTLGANFSWNDLTMDSDTISGGVVLFAEGDRTAYSPEYTIGASVDYVFPLGGGGFEGEFSASANYTSEQEVRSLVDGAALVRAGDPMMIARTSFSIHAPSRWTATLFVDNINDEQGTITGEINGRGLLMRPRTMGLQVEYRY